jgi:uncharacterized membrane protein YdjX (TVP38/TMEM64 family)
MSKLKTSSIVKLVALVVLLVVPGFILGSTLLCGLLDGAGWCSLYPRISPEAIIDYIRASGPWGAGISILIMILHSFIPFPAEFVTVSNGLIFGPLKGFVITWVGAMLGAYLAFGLTRKLGRPFVKRILSEEKLKALDGWIKKHGHGALFVSRFIPVISFNLVNYAAGLTCVSWWTFTWTTGLGILPMTVLLVVMGDRITTLPWEIWALLLALGLAAWLLIHTATRK